MSYTQRVSEDLYPLTGHDPRTRQVATHVSGWVNVEEYHRLWFLLYVGDLGAGASLNAGLEQASTAAGGGVKAIAGKTITTLLQVGGDGPDEAICIELQTEELDVDGGFEFVRFYVTIAVADCTYSAALFGTCSRFKPVAVTNWTEIVG